MDLRRLRAGEWLAAGSAVVLLVSLFLPWYESGGERVSGWGSLAAIDVFLAVVALAALALWVLTVTQDTVAVPLALNSLMASLTLVASALALVRLVDAPLDDASRAVGLFLGVGSTLALTAGVWVAMRSERLEGSGYTDLTGSPAPRPPEPERLPAPKPAEPAQ